MPQDSLFTERNQLIRGLTYASTDTAVTAPSDTLTEPETVDSSTPTSNHVVIPTSGQDTLMHFIGDGNGNAFEVQIYGWSQYFSTTSSQQQWAPTFLIKLDCTCGSGTGVANGIVVVADLYVDTITLDTTNIGTSDYEINSPVDNGKAYIIIRHKGFRYLDVWFDAGTSAANNVAWRNL